jgi:hypothetical protein
MNRRLAIIAAVLVALACSCTTRSARRTTGVVISGVGLASMVTGVWALDSCQVGDRCFTSSERTNDGIALGFVGVGLVVAIVGTIIALE